MCGICGWINNQGVDLQSIMDMNRKASHRGPDGEGYWLYDGSTPSGEWFGTEEVSAQRLRRGMIGLGHRRLSILDLSEAGLQPMASANRQQWIVHNGEIYNYIELRSELTKLGHPFHTETDTEVILAAYRQWGSECFNRFNGMWAMVIVDLEQRRLVLSRDRLGIKPLYYWLTGSSLAFASEIKQFLCVPGFSPAANLNVLAEYIDTGYDLPPETFLKDVKAFPPASVAEIPFGKYEDPQPRKYWDGSSFRVSNHRTTAQAREELRFLFQDAVKLRLRSDVPVGVCLSGGLDSSLIYGQIQSLAQDPQSTHAFSAAFEEKQFDESPFVEHVLAKHGGKIHYTYPNAAGFLDDFRSFIYHHDEPPGGPSQYAAWAVLRLSRENQVPVLLNGQGGDELFSGYWPAYYLYLRQNLFSRPLATASNLVGALLPGGNPEIIRQIPAHFQRYSVRKNRSNCEIMTTDLHHRREQKQQNWAVNAQKLRPETYRWNEISRIHLPRLLKWDDRNAMAFAIEARYPFLDYRMVEYAMQIPVDLNFHAGWNKYMLRTALGHLLPKEIQWRRTKVGFVTPQTHWLSTGLKAPFLNWAENPSPALRQIVDAGQLKCLAQELLTAERIHPMDERQHLLFRLFSIDQWLQIFGVVI